MNYNALANAIRRVYFPPIRGLHAKKKRQRQKSFKKWSQTQGLIYQTNPLLALIEKPSYSGTTGVLLPYGE